jgi:hypothetical protein
MPPAVQTAAWATVTRLIARQRRLRRLRARTCRKAGISSGAIIAVIISVQPMRSPAAFPVDACDVSNPESTTA